MCAASANTTGGFSTLERVEQLPTVVLAGLVVAMVVGAPSGSTGGGVKLDRVLWLGKALGARCGGPGLRWDARPVDPATGHELVRHAGLLVGTWLGLLALVTVMLTLMADEPWQASLFDAASAQSNVGLQTAHVGVDLTPGAKLLLITSMYLGRLELLVALLLGTQRERP